MVLNILTGAEAVVVKLQAAEAISARDIVSMTAPGRVSRATPANAETMIGVAMETVSTDEFLLVIIGGRTKIVADGPISVGSLITPSGVTAGRGVALGTDTGSTGGGGSHTHGVTVPTYVDTYAQAGAITSDGTTLTEAQIPGHVHTTNLGKAIGIAMTAASVAGDEIFITVHRT